MKRSHPDEILAESFRIIDAEVGAHGFGSLEWPIVRRMIHASGDLGLAQLVYFSPGAAGAGVQAFREGVPIVTDVRMVAAGIQAPLREALGVELHCFLDAGGTNARETPGADARETPGADATGLAGKTRCACAMELAVATLPEAVYVIGNAPTALSVLCAAVRSGTALPRLVIAMPVGFVGVVESKERALALPAPVIAVRGRRGGSAVAAAAVNAMLLLAREEGAR